MREGDVTVQLQPGPIVNLELPSFKDLEAKGTEIKVTMYRDFRNFRAFPDPNARLLAGARYDRILESGKATFQLSGTGKFMFRVEVVQVGRRRGTVVKNLKPLSLQIREGVQEFRIQKEK